jgi:tRNA (Thr-GGU) A37 N-methylase
LRVVALLERKGNVLRVRGLDAIDGTPVLDLKPYIFHSDGVPESTVADWLQKATRGSWES